MGESCGCNHETVQRITRLEVTVEQLVELVKSDKAERTTVADALKLTLDALGGRIVPGETFRWKMAFIIVLVSGAVGVVMQVIFHFWK